MTEVATNVCECGRPLTEKVVESYDFSPYLKGEMKVQILGVPVRACLSCDNVYLDGTTVDAAMKAVAAKIIESEDLLGAIPAKLLRRIAGLTQAALADKLGVSRVTVANWERGTKPISSQQDYILRSVVASELTSQEDLDSYSDFAKGCLLYLRHAAEKARKAATARDKFFRPIHTQTIKIAG